VTGARPAENPAPSACDVYAGARQSNTNPCRLDCNVELGTLICNLPGRGARDDSQVVESKRVSSGASASQQILSLCAMHSPLEMDAIRVNIASPAGSSEKGRHCLRKHRIQQRVHRHHTRALKFTRAARLSPRAETFSRAALTGFRRFVFVATPPPG